MAKIVRVTSQTGLNVRPKAKKEGTPVRVLAYGEEVEYTSKNKGWLKVEGGWIMAEFTEEVEAPAEEVEAPEAPAEEVEAPEAPEEIHE